MWQICGHDGDRHITVSNSEIALETPPDPCGESPSVWQRQLASADPTASKKRPPETRPRNRILYFFDQMFVTRDAPEHANKLVTLWS
jgi:hypothetical protein